MRTYEDNAAKLRKRVKRVHLQARVAGVFYLLGALALAVLAFFPLLKIGGVALSVTNFFNPIIDIFKGTVDLLGIVCTVAYLLMLIFVVVNFFRCFLRLGWLTKRSSRYVNGYNRNMDKMREMGNLYSRSFASIINFSFLICVLHAGRNEFELVTSNVLIVLGVGLFVHFLSGVVGGKLSHFDVYGTSGGVQEIKRTSGIFVYFFRNVVQIAATAAIVYVFLPVCSLGATLGGWLGGENPMAGNLLTTLIPTVLKILLVLCTFVLVRHAVGHTEYNPKGIEGKGMMNFRVFAFFVLLVATGVFVLENFVAKPETTAYDYLIIAIIALVAFLVDCIFKTRKVKEHDEEYDPIELMAKLPEQENPETEKPMKKDKARKTEKPEMMRPAYPQGAPVIYQQAPVQQTQQPQSPVYIYQQAPAQQTQQPVYVPVYYPMPQQQPYPYGYPGSAPCYRMQPPCQGYPQQQPCCAQAPKFADEQVSPKSVKPIEEVVKEETPRERRKRLKAEKAERKAAKKAAKAAKKAAKAAKKAEKAAKKAEKVALKAAKKAAKKGVVCQETITQETTVTAQAPIAAAPAVEQPVTPVAEQAETPAILTPRKAPDYLQASPSPMAMMEEAREKGITNPWMVFSEPDPMKTYNVRCPKCGKQLKVWERSPYHRCPACDKVFMIQKFKTYVKKN